MLQNIPTSVLIILGGGLGAFLRYSLSVQLSIKPIPYGTLFVNILGSLLLGSLIALFSHQIISEAWVLFLGTGFLGSFTTMATFVIETISLVDESITLAFRNFILMMTLVFVGASVGQFFTNMIINYLFDNSIILN